MPIIKYSKSAKAPEDQLFYRFPNQMVSETEKSSDDFLKSNMDYFFAVAAQQYRGNKERLVPNYELVKGKLRKEDFYEKSEVASFTDLLMKGDALPDYVQNYSIMTPPINTLIGEMSKRPDNTYVKGFDEESQSEELSFRKGMLQQFIQSKYKEKLLAQAAQQGHELEEGELEELMSSSEELKNNLDTYTSLAERWGVRMLENLKMGFSLKEKSEEAFRDVLIGSESYFHIYEDNTEIGFNTEVLNSVNVWKLTTSGEKYTSDPLDKTVGAYAAGTIEIMELSELLFKFKLTEEEIEHLHTFAQQTMMMGVRESNLFTDKLGEQSVTYDTYDPLVLEYRQLLQAEMSSVEDDMKNFLGVTDHAASFGAKFLVVRAYWCSKKKIGNLTYLDEDGVEQSIMVDENYKKGDHPEEIKLETGWINQWYQGIKIGPDIYYVSPLEILDYCPIIGALFEPKNMSPKSLVDMMKNYQTLFNICMNKLYQLMKKDIGKVFLTSIRHIPTPEDTEYQDAIETWENDARERGIIFIDDSPSNTGGPSGFNQHSVQDLSRAQEMQAYYVLASQLRDECWKLIGISEQRAGAVTASETATATNTSMSQSYAQTEPWFVHHEYLVNKWYQALLDAALYMESNKPLSTIRYISGEGEHAFVQINGSELKLKDLRVFVTSRAEDARNFQEMRQLAQAMLQNGATPYEMALLYSTKSISYMKKIFKDLKEKQDAFQQQQQQIEQQKLDQQQQQFEQAQQSALELHLHDQENENQNKELDRINKKEIAIIAVNSKVASQDANNNGIPDLLETQYLQQDQSKIENAQSIAIQKMNLDNQKHISDQAIKQQEIQLAKEKLKVERERTAAQVKIAQMKPKPAAKKK